MKYEARVEHLRIAGDTGQFRIMLDDICDHRLRRVWGSAGHASPAARTNGASLEEAASEKKYGDHCDDNEDEVLGKISNSHQKSFVRVTPAIQSFCSWRRSAGVCRSEYAPMCCTDPFN